MSKRSKHPTLTSQRIKIFLHWRTHRYPIQINFKFKQYTSICFYQNIFLVISNYNHCQSVNVFMYWVRTILDQWDVTYLFFTGESSILDAPIQAGDPAYDYLVTVRVRIFDIYGDNGTFSTEITVTIKLICYPLQCISCQNQ